MKQENKQWGRIIGFVVAVVAGCSRIGFLSNWICPFLGKIIAGNKLAAYAIPKCKGPTLSKLSLIGITEDMYAVLTTIPF